LRTPKTAAIWPRESPRLLLSWIRVWRVSSFDGASRLEKGRRDSPERLLCRRFVVDVICIQLRHKFLGGGFRSSLVVGPV